MRRISSEAGAAVAKGFAVVPIPVFLFIAGAAIHDSRFKLPGAAAALALLGLYIWCVGRFAWSLMDEVLDGGDYLIVKRGAVADEICLSDIEDVSGSLFSRQRKLILTLRAKSAFGWRIVFVPSTSASDLAGITNVAADLRKRARAGTSQVAWNPERSS